MPVSGTKQMLKETPFDTIIYTFTYSRKLVSLARRKTMLQNRVFLIKNSLYKLSRLVEKISKSGHKVKTMSQ